MRVVYPKNTIPNTTANNTIVTIVPTAAVELSKKIIRHDFVFFSKGRKNISVQLESTKK